MIVVNTFSFLFPLFPFALPGSSLSLWKVDECFDFIFGKSLSFLQEWSQIQSMGIIVILTCTFMFIPSSQAVDALKTCTCLLKECRYLSMLISNSYHNFSPHPLPCVSPSAHIWSVMNLAKDMLICAPFTTLRKFLFLVTNDFSFCKLQRYVLS